MMIKSIVNIFDIGPHLHDIMCAQWMNVKTEQSVIAYGAQFLSLSSVPENRNTWDFLQN